MSREAFETDDDWSYSGATGPEHWGEIAPICASGRLQSPINLDGFSAGELPPLQFHYDVRAERLVNNGHAVQVHFAPGGAIEVDGHRYVLDHLHFHSPAEHRIEDRTYALEAHFVHKDSEGANAVVALLYEEGQANATFAKIAGQLPASAAENHDLREAFSAADFLPASHDYYFYSGSLTTPPGSEGVAWYILKSPLTIAIRGIEGVLRADGGPNNRPIQARNGRKILG